MFGSLIEEIRIETVKRDLTNVYPYIKRRADAAVANMKHSGNYSRSKLRKLGILPNPYKKRKSKPTGDGS